MKLLALLALTTSLMAQITISDAQMKKMGITTSLVSITNSTQAGPYIAKIDYDEAKSKSYFTSNEASVVALYVHAGDTVTRGKLLCKIASPQLLSSSFELKELKNRFSALKNNAAKDETLYKEGIISYRDYQTSSLEVASLRSRIGALEAQFILEGVAASSDGTFNVLAQQSGIVTQAPLSIAEKIIPYQPYFRISNATSMVAMLNISPKQISLISKGDKVLDSNTKPIGTIISVSPAINSTSNSAVAIAKITNIDGNLRAGTSTNLYVSTSKPITSILIPASAIVNYQGKNICFIKTPTGFRAQELRLQSVSKEGALVQQRGIDKHTAVATSGLIILKGAMSGLGFE
jgi:multidrug efflux pump subunit AcrA (membrane-fusion protein)